jgi:hypothetical protein
MKFCPGGNMGIHLPISDIGIADPPLEEILTSIHRNDQ